MLHARGKPLAVDPVQPAALGIGRLFDSVSDGVIAIDLDGRIVLWNAAAEQIFGTCGTRRWANGSTS